MSARVFETERNIWQKAMYWLAVATVVSMPLILTACNTMEGAGEDIEAAGESIQDASE